MIRVIVVDDHELIREGLRKVFDRESDIELVDTGRCASDAIDLLRQHEVDVVVMDFNMPGRSGLDVIDHLHALKPGLPVLILSMMPERDLAMRALKAGAAGFVSKESAATEIVDALRRVASGKRYLSPELADVLATQVVNPVDDEQGGLTNREFQVLRMIASGKKSRIIAEDLSLSVNTVATYRRRIYEKLGLRSEAEITRYALDHSLID